jgi:hypothetical protein
MINCYGWSFKQIFSHVKAHQDDGEEYRNLDWESQLNCQMDYHAKRAIWLAVERQQQDMATKSFPLEPICVFLGQNKLTLDKEDQLRF